MKEYKTDEQKMKFYKSREWRGVNGIRNRVLERDNYECQECKRQGKVFIADRGHVKHKQLDVDHIQAIETHPDLANDMSNLQTLCIKCHNRKHGRFLNWKMKKNKWNDDEKW